MGGPYNMKKYVYILVETLAEQMDDLRSDGTIILKNNNVERRSVARQRQ
jgi:hypothetical protein